METPETDSHAAAESIAARDLNNLYLASSCFTDREKFKAFCAYYAVMRVVDDRIDGLASRATLLESERNIEHDVISAWEAAVSSCYGGVPLADGIIDRCDHPAARLLIDALRDSLLVFPPPEPLWAHFFGAMRRDLDHVGFESWSDFLAYTEGASVSPTTIYLYLIVARAHGEPGSVPADFDLVECGRKLGTFAYIGHVVRDLAEDLRTGDGLMYLSREDLLLHGVTEQLLFSDLAQGGASHATRELVADLVARARSFLSAGRSSMSRLQGHLDPDCEFILELIVTVYERVLDKIEACSFDPMGHGHRLTREDKWHIMSEVARQVGFEGERDALARMNPIGRGAPDG